MYFDGNSVFDITQEAVQAQPYKKVHGDKTSGGEEEDTALSLVIGMPRVMEELDRKCRNCHSISPFLVR